MLEYKRLARRISDVATRSDIFKGSLGLQAPKPRPGQILSDQGLMNGVW